MNDIGPATIPIDRMNAELHIGQADTACVVDTPGVSTDRLGESANPDHEIIVQAILTRGHGNAAERW